MRFLVAESEPREARQTRRESAGRSSGEAYADTLREVSPGVQVDRVKPADAGARLPDVGGIEAYDAVFLTGSPLHLYKDSPEVRRELDFMRAVFASGTPSFGSCAGLQVATVAAGGTVRPMGRRREAGFARRIAPTDEGRCHPLLRGRPRAFDAPALHSDEVETLPEGGRLLAASSVTKVQAVEIRVGPGIFWGVQYHPELPLADIAQALRRDADDLIEHGLAREPCDVEAMAGLVEDLANEPGRLDLAWRLGLDEEVTDDARRTTELRNFIEQLVIPTRAERGRG